MVGLEGSPLHGLLLENPNPNPKMVNSNNYFSQLDQLKAEFCEKHQELVNRKPVIFQQDNARPHVSLMTRQKL